MLFTNYFADGLSSTNDEVCEIYDNSLVLTAATNNQLMVTGAAGFRIVLLSFDVNSTGAASSIAIKDASAGTIKKRIFVPANTGAQPNVVFPLSIAPGHVRAAPGNGLYVDCGAISVNLNFQHMFVRV